MRATKPYAVFLFFLTLAAPSFCQPFEPPPETAAPITSESLLQRAHALLPGLTLPERLTILSRLAEVRNHREDASAWTEEGFVLAAQAPDRATRVQTLMMLFVALADLDSRAALDKLAQAEPPLHPNDEDFREPAAMSIFSAFHRDHPAEIETIVATARHIGDTGTYPFTAVSSVISVLVRTPSWPEPVSQEHREQASVLVQDAVRYFRQCAPTDRVNEQFANFLLFNSDLLSPESLRPVVEELVGRLARLPQPPVDRMITVVPDKGNGPAVVERNRNHVLLAQLMPLIRSLDPSWEQKLRQSPEIGRLAEKLEDYSGVAVLGGYAIGQSEDKTILQLRSAGVQMHAYRDPEGAAKALNQISDPVQNAAIMAALAQATVNSNPADSAQWLTRVRQGLERIKGPEDRLIVLYPVVRALVAAKQRDQLTVALDESFSALDEMVSALGAKHPDSRITGDRLAGIVQAAAKTIPEHVLLQIESVRVPALQANLLIAMARGLDTED